MSYFSTNATAVYLMLHQRFAVVGGKEWYTHALHTWTCSRRWTSMLAWINKDRRNPKDFSVVGTSVSEQVSVPFSKLSTHIPANTRQEAKVLRTGWAQSHHTVALSHLDGISWLTKSLHRYGQACLVMTLNKISSMDPFECLSNSFSTFIVRLWIPTIAQDTGESAMDAIVWNSCCHDIMRC